MKVVYVRWNDSATIGGWRGIKRFKAITKSHLEIVDTVGMLAFENKQKVILIQTVGSNEVLGIFEIPRTCIKSIKVLCQLPIELDLEG